MASPGNQHCDTSIGTLSLPTVKNFTTEYNTGEKKRTWNGFTLGRLVVVEGGVDCMHVIIRRRLCAYLQIASTRISTGSMQSSMCSISSGGSNNSMTSVVKPRRTPARVGARPTSGPRGGRNGHVALSRGPTRRRLSSSA